MRGKGKAQESGSKRNQRGKAGPNCCKGYFKLGGDSGKEVFCRFRRHKGYRFDSWIGTHSSILAQRITWTEETGGLQFIVSQREHTAHKSDEKSLEGSGPGELELIQNLIGLFYLLHGIETRGIKGRSSVQ